MKRVLLSPGRIYTESLEEVLGLSLDADSLHAKVARKEIESIAADVRALSDALTGQAGAVRQRHYLAKPRFQRAYRLYYTTTNFLKIVPPLRELHASGFFDRDSLRVLDLGTGTGAAIWGLIQFVEEDLRKPITLHVTAIDAVSENLAFVRTMAQAVVQRCSYVTLVVTTQQLDLESISDDTFMPDAFDLVTMMNTLNELGPRLRKQLHQTFARIIGDHGHVIVIEPASKTASRGLLEFRDAAVTGGYTIYAPCTRQAHCPALGEEDDWCHGEYHWERPRYIALIDEIAGLVRLSIKSSYITLNRQGATLSGAFGIQSHAWRVVGDRSDEKGRVRAMCCSAAGKCDVVLNKRDKTLANKQFYDVERYDLLEISAIEHREHDSVLSEASEVRVVLRATGAR